MKNTLVVNLFGGPGAGKSTMMHGIMAELKWRNIDVEAAPEYAKEVVWSGEIEKLENQEEVTNEQYIRIKRLQEKVDVIVTDSPILVGIIYDKTGNKKLLNDILNKHAEFDNANFYVHRFKIYNPNGRIQTEQEAKQKDTEMLDILHKFNIPFENIKGKREAVFDACDHIQGLLNKI